MSPKVLPLAGRRLARLPAHKFNSTQLCLQLSLDGTHFWKGRRRWAGNAANRLIDSRCRGQASLQRLERDILWASSCEVPAEHFENAQRRAQRPVIVVWIGVVPRQSRALMRKRQPLR